MAAAVFMTMDGSVLKFADDEASLATTPTDVSCQINDATITNVPKSTTVPATFCQAETEAALASGSTLDVTFLQDWTDSAGFSWYLFDNDAQTKFFSLSLGDAAGPAMSGQVGVSKGDFGGAGGAVLQASISLPVIGDLTPTVPVP